MRHGRRDPSWGQGGRRVPEPGCRERLSTRPGFPPTRKASEGHSSPSVSLSVSGTGSPSGLQHWGRTPVPQTAWTHVGLSVLRGTRRAAAIGAMGRGARRRQDDPGGGAGGTGTGLRGLYRPAPWAAAAVPRGTGSSTIVSGRSGGGRSTGCCRAPGSAPSRRRHAGHAAGKNGVTRGKALRSQEGRWPAAPMLHRRHTFDSSFIVVVGLLAGVSLPFKGKWLLTHPSSKCIDR